MRRGRRSGFMTYSVDFVAIEFFVFFVVFRGSYFFFGFGIESRLCSCERSFDLLCF
jgi:hypothetical protein